jgi:hypothetical protein
MTKEWDLTMQQVRLWLVGWAIGPNGFFVWRGWLTKSFLSVW